MKFFNRWGIFSLLLISIIILFYISYNLNQKNESQQIQDFIFTLTTSLVAGLIIAMIQFLLEWKKHRQSEEFRRLGVKKILSNREDDELYGEIILNTHERLWVLGNTSSRFLVDFADERKNKVERRALFKALEKGVEVKILVVDKRYLANIEEKSDFDFAKKRFQKIKLEFPDNFYFRYYSHAPNHSVFVFDYECFIGPIFKGVRSRDTPSIHTQTNRDFAKKYLNHFEKEWSDAKEI